MMAKTPKKKAAVKKAAVKKAAVKKKAPRKRTGTTKISQDELPAGGGEILSLDGESIPCE